MKSHFLKVTALAMWVLVLASCEGKSKSGSLNESEINPAEQALQLNDPEPAEKKISGEGSEIKPFPAPAPELRNQVNALLDDYMELKNQLVQSSAEGAAGAEKNLLRNIDNFKASGLPEDQQQYYTEKAEALKKFTAINPENPDLEAQRERFSAITENMYALSKAFNAGNDELYYQYCPMAFNNNGGHWLSNSSEIRNPYYGEKMLKCGRVSEIISNK